MDSIVLASIDNLNVGYVVTNIDHEVVIINYAARELLKAARQIKTLEEVVTKLPKRLALLDHVKYCSIEHKSCGFQEVQLSERTVRLFLSPIFIENDLRGNLITLEDITDKIEQERTRNQFLSFLVHEFRTPLTAIRGNSSLLEMGYEKTLHDEQFTEMVQDISTGSEYLLGMVNQFLDMARLEEGRIKYELESFDLAQLLQETIRSLDVIAQDHKLSLRLAQPSGSTIEVVADRQRTKQILTNLIGNGLKFTEHGGVTVSFEIADQVVAVSVSDTGAGIPASSQSKLFQKFFQADNNKMQADSSKSTGLGLYATKLMVEGMGGNIQLASSVPDKGSTFTFTLDVATLARLKKLEKQLYDAKQGVVHAPAVEHHSIALKM